MVIKRLLLAGAIAASLAGAGVLGVLIGTPSVSYADDAADEDPGSGPQPGPPGPGRGPGQGPPASLEVAAEAIGIPEEDLRAELESGESVTSVAEAESVDIDTVIDALVADATAHIRERVDAGDLDAEEAAERTEELPDRIAEFVAREGLPPRGDC